MPREKKNLYNVNMSLTPDNYYRLQHLQNIWKLDYYQIYVNWELHVLSSVAAFHLY